MTRADEAGHLRRSGADIAALVAGLSAADLAAGDGRVRRFAQIAIRHATTTGPRSRPPWPRGPPGGATRATAGRRLRRFVRHERTPGWPDDLAAVLHSTGPHPEQAEQLSLFGRFIGAWEYQLARDRQSGARRPPWPVSCTFRVACWRGSARSRMYGRCRPPGGRPGLRPFYGTTLASTPAIGAWRSTWIDPLNGRVRRFIGRPEGADIVLDGLDDDPPERWGFRDVFGELLPLNRRVSPGTAAARGASTAKMSSAAGAMADAQAAFLDAAATAVRLLERRTGRA